MKNLLAFFLFVCSTHLFSQTSIPGGNVSGTWTLSGSPYQIQGSVQIPDGQTLTIDPGVTVEFQGTYKLNVQGRLLAVGTITDTIIFTVANIANGWRGIRFINTPVTNDTSRLYYCKLQYGKATGSSPDDKGGAFYSNNYSKVIVSHCRISNGAANCGGGGFYCSSSNITITHNNISGNIALDCYGGGIYCDNSSSPIISNNSISNNTASQSCGGGIYCDAGSDPAIFNNNISNNSASYGGGIGCRNGSSPVITDNIISNNNTVSSGPLFYGGGGIYCYQSNATITNNIISNNIASNTNGGGINCWNNNPGIVISNNIISNNSAANGGGVRCYNSSPTFINNTIANNNAVIGGALYCDQASGAILINCILWGNTASTSGQQVFMNDEASDPSFYYCDVQGGSAAFELNGNFYSGTYSNNINIDPKFSSPSGGSGTGFNGITADWYLQPSSPCIDQGDPSGTYSSTDILGNPRVLVCRIDMGAYEFNTGNPLTATVSMTEPLCNGNANGIASVTVSGGNAPYTYMWSGGQTTTTATGFLAGDYTVAIVEGSGCALTKTITITQPAAISVTVTATPTLYNGYLGTAGIDAVVGGTPPYSYSWSPTGQTTSLATGLGTGEHTLTVTDQNFCTKTAVVTILNAPPTISGFTPGSGPVGTIVTITGTNFNPTTANNIVFFGSTMATVITASTTSLTVTVPVGATYQYIAVTDQTTSLMANSTQPFVVTFPCNSAISANSFATGIDSSGGTYPTNVAMGDLDGDGKSDIIVINQYDNTVSVLRNTSVSGTVSFSSRINFATGSWPFRVTVGDINGDGKPELAVANYVDNTVSVLKNTSVSGTISFSPKIDFTTGARPTAIAISDLDSDGKPELAVSNHDDNTVSILLNTSTAGTISFAPKSDLTAGQAPYNIAVGDLDGDGKIDLAVVHWNGSFVSDFRNTSTIGSISFASKVDFPTEVRCSGVSIGDLDGDSKPDMAVASYSMSVVSTLRNTGSSGTISFAPKVDFPTGANPWSIAINDLDGNGKPDIATANNQGYSISVLNNTSASGNISFSSKEDFSYGNQLNSAVLGDVDGDKQPDIVLASEASGSVSILRNLVGVGQIMTSPGSATICSGTALNLSLTSSMPATYSWIAGDNPNTSGESITQQISGVINNVIINNSGALQTITYTVIPTTTSGSCVGSPQMVTISVRPLPIISFTVNPDTCVGGVGKVTASVSGGSLPYSYLWSNNGTAQVISNISAASYSLTVHDANSCSASASATVGIFTSTISPTLTALPDTCTASVGAFGSPTGGTAPYSYIWNNGSTTGQAVVGLATGNYTITITDKNGCSVSALANVGLYSSTIVPTLTAFPDTCTGNVGLVISNPIGGTAPFNYLWSNNGSNQNINGLTSGSYSVVITDKNGCSVVDSVVVAIFTSTITPTLTSLPDTCAGNVGIVMSNPIGGTAPYNYLWSNNGSNQIINGLTPGSYSVVITDKNGCTAFDSAVVANYTSTVTISFGSVPASCQNADGSITANPSGGAIPYAYVWSTGSSSQTVSNILAGNYSVTVTDKNGCAATGNSTIGTNNTIATPAVCMVTVDSLSQNNVIMWDKTAFAHIDSFIVMRETSANTYSPIGAVPYDSLSLFVDTVRTKYFPNTGDPNTGTYRYKLKMVDSCGNYSQLSPFHNTIYIINNSGTFSWPQLYTIEGSSNPVSNYVLLRDNISNGNWTVVSSVTGTQQTITDPLYATYQATASWRVETQWSISCSPTKANPSAQSFNTSRSNIFSFVNSVNEFYNNPLVSIFPNPFSETATVQFAKGYSENCDFIMMDIYGRDVKNLQIPAGAHSIVIDRDGLSGGMYFYKVSNKNAVIATGKMIIE